MGPRRKKHFFAEMPENRDKVSVMVRFWVRISVRVRTMVRVRTFVFIDGIVYFMAFLRNVFSSQCRRRSNNTIFCGNSRLVYALDTFYKPILLLL